VGDTGGLHSCFDALRYENCSFKKFTETLHRLNSFTSVCPVNRDMKLKQFNALIIDRVAGAIIRLVASVCVCLPLVCGRSPFETFDL